MKRRIVFIVDLVQDVAIIAPIVRLAAKVAGTPITVFASDEFGKRDTGGTWAAELDALAAETGSTVERFDAVADLGPILQRFTGVLFAPSESRLPAHARVNAVVRAARTNYRTVAVQHGYENIGLLHHESHDQHFGKTVEFDAQILLSWFPADRLKSLSPHQRSKLYVAGPPQLIAPVPRGSLPVGKAALICENLHSVRMRTPEIVNAFKANVRALAADGRYALALRPHPSRIFLARNPELMADVTEINDAPLYRQDLSRFGFAISAPSSVVLDFALAGVPVAVWNAGGTASSVANYEGLTVLDLATSWSTFVDRVATDAAAVVAEQDRFVAGLGIPGDVAARYAALLRL